MLHNSALSITCVCVYKKIYVCVPVCVRVYVCVCACAHCVFGHNREGIQWEAIDWMDNAECLDLIEKVTDSKICHQERWLTTSRSVSTQAPHCLH